MQKEIKIFSISPAAVDFRYGKQLNQHIECFPDDSWILVTDRDSAFLGDRYSQIIHQAIQDHPDCSLFTCQTNRLREKRRCYRGEISKNRDIVEEFKIARDLERKFFKDPDFIKYQEIGSHVAGLMWLFPKKTWFKNKFDNHPIFYDNQSFDVRWSNKIKGQKIMIMGLYIWHYYRMHKQKSDFRHLVSK